ncbi:MAG: DapH/DapD/GlmU-related protein [Candidatus Limnocylindria bacterium]
MTTLGNAVHPTAIVAPNVRIGNGSVVGEYAILGRPPRGKKEGELELVIGPGSVIRPFTTIYAGTTIGARLQTGQGASIREDNVLGDDVSVGTHASLEFGNRIGSRVRIHTGCFLELVTVEDDVFLGPHVVFTDDPHPMCPAYLDCVKGGTVRRRARIGANSTILPGVEIGEDSLVGAGSVVRRPVRPRSVVAGNPAVELKEDIRDLACFVGIFPHAYSWLDDLPARRAENSAAPLPDERRR